jgi:crossover junction endodeoxyribonuclease RusA
MAKAYRRDCAWLAHHAEPTVPDEGPIAVAITFRPPDKRARDLDNMLAAIKPHLDGVADALHVNDARFVLTIARGEPHKGGVVEVTL